VRLGEADAHRDGFILDEATLRHVAVVLLRGHIAAACGSRGSDLKPHTRHAHERWHRSRRGGSQAG
jgi:hypothetical protein